MKFHHILHLGFKSCVKIICSDLYFIKRYGLISFKEELMTLQINYSLFTLLHPYPIKHSSVLKSC